MPDIIWEGERTGTFPGWPCGGRCLPWWIFV